MDADDFNELIGIFVAETQEFLHLMEEKLLLLESSSISEQRLQAVKELFRAAHSIKGSALMFGFEPLANAAHVLEDCFAILRDRVDLSQLHSTTITLLLQGVDYLKKIAEQACKGGKEITGEMDGIAQIAAQLEAQYGKQDTSPHLGTLNSPINQPTIKAIFADELPPVLNRLETEISQADSDRLEQTVAAINDIYYQLSGLAGILQLPKFGQIAEQLRSLVDTPELTVEQLQSSGWEIAQDLQTARSWILQEGRGAQEETGKAAERESGRAAEKEESSSSLPTPNSSPLTSHPSPLTPHPSPPTPHSSPLTPHPLRPTIRVDLERLTELVNLVGELVINRTNLELQESQLRSEAKRVRKSISELHQFSSQLREEYDRLAGEPGGRRGEKKEFFSSLPTPHSSPLHSSPLTSHSSPLHFDPLEMDSYTELHSIAQSMIEASVAIAQSGGKIDELAVQFERSTDQLRRITDQLRHRVMQLRVVPFSRAVDHLPRALRELCRTYNKEVNLLLLGRDTQIDESLLDALRDPLVHLLRNAFDHGIEPPDVRVRAGKPASGQIEIGAMHQGGQTIITITDDGKGIDPELVRRRIVAMGLVAPEPANELSIAELYEFLFWPGFSTADEVTDLSGRGVGLDVVRTNLQQVRGTIKLDSRPGKGTSFILKLPLVLSITDALLVRVDHNTVAVPLDAVEELLYLEADRIQMAGNQPMLRWREEFIKLVRLQELLHYNLPHLDNPSPDPLAQDYIPVMVLSSSEGVLAVAVERLIGQQEIVVKSLPAPLSKPRGIVGNTILGDGRVVMILDVDELIGQSDSQTGTSILPERVVGRNLPVNYCPLPISYLQPQILVVDDSYSIRELLSLALKRANYRVIQAKDGQDALEKLEEESNCALAIVDIEMPRMDGFELLRSLKSHPHFAPIPIVMLTSRSGHKHRQMAMELGAVQYFTKPYNEAQLLDAIAKLLNRQ